MNVPESVGYGTVVGRFFRVAEDGTDEGRAPDAVPMPGVQARFEAEVNPGVVRVSGPDAQVLKLDTIIGFTDDEGVLRDTQGNEGVTLMASDSPYLDPQNWTWKVTLSGGGLPTRCFDLFVTQGSLQDLADVIPVPDNPGDDIAGWYAASQRADLALTNAESLLERINAGEFKGKQGDEGPPGPNTVPTAQAIADAFEDADSPARSAADAIYLPPNGVKTGGAAFLRSVGKGELVITPRDFGPIGEGVDHETIQKCLDYASQDQTRGYVVWFNQDYDIYDTLRWDVARTRILGTSSLIRSYINDASKFMVQTYSTDKSGVSSPIWQSATSMEGVILQGDRVTGGISISGVDSSDKSAHTVFEKVTVTRCGTAIYFGRNAYMMKFFGCNITLSTVGLLHDDAPNSGERLDFHGCDITGHGRAIELRSGQAMHFTSCSFSYVLRQIAYVTQGQLFFHLCHLEFSSPYAPFFELTGNGAYVEILGGRWLVRDQPFWATTVRFEDGVAKWTDNVRGRLQVGDRIEITYLTGDSNIVKGNRYYVHTITDTYFELSLTKGGPKMPITGTGVSTRITPLQDGTVPIFQTNHWGANVVMIAGHPSGSAGQVKLWHNGGPGSCVIKHTGTFDNNSLRLHNSPGGDLRDGLFSQPRVFDQWYLESENDGLYVDTTDRANGVNSLRFTRGAGSHTSRLRLLAPIERGRQLLSMMRKNPQATVTFSAQYLDRPDGIPSAVQLGSSLLWSSNLAATDSWTSYEQVSQYGRISPHWARYILFTFNTQSLPVGATLKIDSFQLSTS